MVTPINGLNDLTKMFELSNIKPNKITMVALVAIGLAGGAMAGAGAVAISLVTITAFPIVVGALVGAGIGLAIMATAAKIVDLVKGSFKTAEADQSETDTPIIHTDLESVKNAIKNNPSDQYFEISEEMGREAFASVRNNDDIMPAKCSIDGYKYAATKTNEGERYFIVKKDVSQDTINQFTSLKKY